MDLKNMIDAKSTYNDGEAFEMAGVIIVKGDVKTMQYFIDKKLSAEQKETLKDVLSDEPNFSKWEPAFTPATRSDVSTKCDASTKSSVDDIIDDLMGTSCGECGGKNKKKSDDIDDILDGLMGKTGCDTKSKPAATYSFSSSYGFDGFLSDSDDELDKDIKDLLK